MVAQSNSIEADVHRTTSLLGLAATERDAGLESIYTIAQPSLWSTLAPPLKHLCKVGKVLWNLEAANLSVSLFVMFHQALKKFCDRNMLVQS